jgi:hypothetical protein
MTSKSPPALFAVLVSTLTSLVALMILWLQDTPGFLRDLPIMLATLACGVAVIASLGAALIIARTSQQPILRTPDPSLRYRDAVEMAWTNEKLSEAESRRLDQLGTELGLGRDQAREIELQIMGRGKEELVAPEEPLLKKEVSTPEEPRETRVVYRADPAALYRAVVKMAWADRKLNEAEQEQLGDVERNLKVAGGRAEEIEREIMGGTREELVSPDDIEDDGEKYSQVDELWMDLVQECVGVVKDLDRHMGSFDPARQELADHVILGLAEGLERTGVDLILGDDDFDSKRHESVEAKSGSASGATIAETLSPGFAVGRRVLRKAQVRVE